MKPPAKARQSLPPLDLLQRYSIDEACLYLRVSRASFFKKLKAGVVMTIQEGKRRFIPGSEIAKLSAQAGVAGAGVPQRQFATPQLGLATSRELLDELRARMEVAGILDFRTVAS